jgi:hypothetical protein
MFIKACIDIKQVKLQFRIFWYFGIFSIENEIFLMNSHEHFPNVISS